MVAIDYAPLTKQGYDDLRLAHKSDTLNQSFASLLSREDASKVSVESILAKLPRIISFTKEDEALCGEEGCNRVAANIELSNGGAEKWEKFKSTGNLDYIRDSLLCDGCVAGLPDVVTNLCPCLREKCLAQTRRCTNCGASRCQGVLVPDTNTGNMTRTFFCKNRSPQDVEHGRGAILDDGENGNMSQSQTRNKCRDCDTGRKEHLICTFEGCTKVGCHKGQRCKTHQLDKKICTFEGCTKIGDQKGQRCKTHKDK